MTRQSAPRTAIMAAMAASATPAQAQGGSISVSFADIPINALPPGFASERTGRGTVGDWKIVADDTMAAGRVLTQAVALAKLLRQKGFTTVKEPLN